MCSFKFEEKLLSRASLRHWFCTPRKKGPKMDRHVAGRNAGKYVAISSNGNVMESVLIALNKWRLIKAIPVFILVLFSQNSMAVGSVVPTKTITAPISGYVTQWSNTPVYTTQTESCAASTAALNAAYATPQYFLDSANPYYLSYCHIFLPANSGYSGYIANIYVLSAAGCPAGAGLNGSNQCVSYTCPVNSQKNATPPTACICDANFQPDSIGKSCVPDVTCPIPKFPDINDSDACTRSLEKGKGKDVEGVCEPLDPEIVKQEQCLAKKIRDLGINYTEPSATVRTAAYQQHFVDLWEWHEVKIPNAREDWTDAEKQECAPIVAKVEAEWNTHKLKGAPSNSGAQAPHVQRKAVDIDEAVVEAMKKKVSSTTFVTPSYCLFCMPPIPVHIGDVQDYVNSALVNPPSCKLRWGGRFRKYDGVHFDLFLK